MQKIFSRQTNTLRVELVRWVGILSLIAILAIIAVIAVSLRASLQNTGGQLNEVGLMAAYTFDEFLSSIKDDLLATSDALATNSDLNKVFQHTLSRQPAIFELILVDPQDQVLIQQRRVGEVEPYLTEQPWLASVQAGKVYIGPVDYGEFGVPFVDIAVAVADDMGNFSATLLAKVDLTTLWDTVIRFQVGESESGYVYITDEKGQLLVYRDLKLVQRGITLENAVDRTPQAITEAGANMYIGLSGERVIASGVPLSTISWFVIVEQPVSEGLFLFASLAVVLLVLLVVVVLLVYGIVLFTRRRIVLPLILLREGVDILRQGNLEHRIDIQTKDEFGTLASTFNSMGTQLQETIDTLEQRVADRTRGLQTAAEVARATILVLDPDKLIGQAVDLVGKRFDLYYVGLFLLDKEQRFAVLHSGTGEVGQQMMAQGQKLEVSGDSMVGQCIAEGEVHIMPDGDEEVIRFDNPLLPDTRTEVVLPLRSRGRTIGAMTVQSIEEAAFDEADIAVMQTMADQVAVAIDNAQLFAQNQVSLEEAAGAKEVAEKAQEKAEAANQAKSTFLSSMSHELRTPLNGILGYTQILKRKRGLDTAQRDGLNIIQQSGEHLLTLINDTLDLAKIEAGKMELYPNAVNLSSFLTGLAGLVRMRAEEKNVYFKFAAAEQLPIGVQVDETRLRQVLLNLLGNAVKFTSQGQVTLRVTSIGRLQSEGEEQQQRLRFEVEDSGVGMSAEEVANIFLPFEQVGATATRQTGTGLGLSISRQLVELMGGEVQVKSKKEQGSLFWFEVVLPVVEAPQTATVVSGQVKGYKGPRRTILVVDDKRDNRLVLASMLEPLGFEIVLAKDGQEEIDRAREMRPDLILTDLVMPIKTGFEAVEELRQLPDFKETPILAVSASVFDTVQSQSQVSGCDAFIPKPVDENKLLALIGQHLQLEWIYEEAEAVAEAEAVDEKLVPPPAESLEELYDLVMLGDMRELQNMALELENGDGKYVAFVQKVQTLAKGFKQKELLALFEQYLAMENGS